MAMGSALALICVLLGVHNRPAAPAAGIPDAATAAEEVQSGI
jgi:hypothetical protein